MHARMAFKSKEPACGEGKTGEPGSPAHRGCWNGRQIGLRALEMLKGTLFSEALENRSVALNGRIAFPCLAASGVLMRLDSTTVAGAAPELDRLPMHLSVRGR